MVGAKPLQTFGKEKEFLRRGDLPSGHEVGLGREKKELGGKDGLQSE